MLADLFLTDFKGILFFFIYIFLVSSSIMIIFVTQVNLFYLNFKFVL